MYMYQENKHRFSFFHFRKHIPSVFKSVQGRQNEPAAVDWQFPLVLGPVQTSCFCRAELNSGIKFDKSTTEARRLNQTFELSSASN